MLFNIKRVIECKKHSYTLNMKIILIGYSGKMGKAVSDVALNKHVIIPVDFSNSEEFFSHSEKLGDVIIDFSSPKVTDKLCKYAEATKTPLVIGTTGHGEEQVNIIENLSQSLPIFLSGNMSIGIALFAKHLKEIIRFYPDAEVDIIETHHTDKIDAPSGTALLLARAIQSVSGGRIISGMFSEKRRNWDINVLSRRMGKTVGEHKVIINTKNQVLTLTHNALDRTLFAEGAISASEFILTKSKGLYSIEDLINLKAEALSENIKN